MGLGVCLEKDSCNTLSDSFAIFLLKIEANKRGSRGAGTNFCLLLFPSQELVCDDNACSLNINRYC